MRRLLMFLILFSLGPAESVCQTKEVKPSKNNRIVFDFHGDALRETWSDFQRRHEESGTHCEGSDAAMKAYGFIPLLRGPKIDPSSPEYEVLSCTVDGPPQTLVGMEVNARYKFYKDQLIDIRILYFRGKFADQSAYQLIKDAYTEKYGNADKIDIDKYQNGYGAVFYGESSTWLNSSASLMLLVTDFHGESVAVNLVDLEANKKMQRPAKSDDL